MEDFARELNQGSGLFFLYGENGVGKTRLLRELSQSRLNDRTVYWLDLDSDAGNEETRMDRSTEIEALFAAANNGDIIIADHFEMSLKKSRHQLFLSWSTDGVDKQLNLIVASNTSGLDELRQLSQQYQVPVQSFEQLPFNPDEVRAFLGFQLFPDQPTAKLAIPSSLRKRIAATSGVVAQLIDIVALEGEQITAVAASAPGEPIGHGGKLIYALLLLVVLAAGAGFYLYDQHDFTKIPALAGSEPVGVEISEAIPETVPQTVPETVSEAGNKSGDAPEPQAAMEDLTTPGADDKSAAAPALADVGDTGNDSGSAIALQPANGATVTGEGDETSALSTQPAPGITDESSLQPESDKADAEQAQAEPGTASDSEAVIDESVIASHATTKTAIAKTIAEPAPMPETGEARFELELQQSMDWIRQREDKVGTIQILLLSYENFDVDNYYEYVDDLTRRGADSDKLHVFKTLTGNRQVYSVVYDEFASRKAAIGAIAELPAVLRETSPLARSVGGLWQEIRRLEAAN
jgi:septal ring-binding cell division protein DamX